MTGLRSDIAALTAGLSDRYGLQRELGRGGMATVYLARDLKHDRSVALKVLHPELAATLGPERFQREIRFAARLQHPHILTVLDSGEAAGQLWFTMPYVEGESLRERLRHERQLSIDDALRITREVAQALQYAHEHGVIHRDVKPENILLTKDGNTLVADFGVARALGGDESLTQTGLAVGTPAYMSPEQAAGEHELDARTDVYALGCVLYEMLAGEPPFTGPTAQAVIAKRFNTAPTPVRITRPEVPEEVDQAVLRALARTPADRFASAGDLVQALRVNTTHAGTTANPPSAPARGRLAQGLVGLGVVLAVGLGAIWLKSRTPEPAPSDASAFAVLPFRAVGPGLDLWREGLVDLLAINLDGAGGLRAIAPRTVLSRWHRDVGTGDADQERALSVAEALGARYALTGSIVGGSGNLRLAAELLDARTGAVIGRSQAEGPADSIPALVDRLSLGLVRAGLPYRGIRPALDLRSATTTSLPALKSMLAAEQLFRRGRAADAVAEYRNALAADSTFALAAYRLVIAGSWTASPHEVGGVDPEALTRAVRLADRLPPKEAAVARTFDLLQHGSIRALVPFQTLVERNPDDAEAWFLYGDALFHLGGPSLRSPESFRVALRRATTLDPEFAPAYLHMAEDAFDRLDSTEVARIVAVLQRIDAGSPRTIGLTLAAARVWGDSASRAMVRRALDTAPGQALLTAKHAINLTPDLAEHALTFALALGEQSRHSTDLRAQGFSGAAYVYRGLGQLHQAAEMLRRLMGIRDLPADLRRQYEGYFVIGDFLAGLGDTTLADSSYGELVAYPDSALDAEWLGRYAALRHRATDLPRWTAELQRRVTGAIARGDTLEALTREQDLRMVRAYEAEMKGDSGAVLQALRSGVADYPGGGWTEWTHNAPILRLELARRLLRAGEYGEARRRLDGFGIAHYWLNSAPGLIELYRGEVAEGLNEPDDAKEHYARVVRWWRDCDRELVPLREQARDALARLSAEPRGSP